jgi:uncharacterized integral membrane protein
VSEQNPEAGQEAGQEAPPRLDEETRLQRSLRYGHRTGLYTTLVLGIVALVLLILLIARNTRQVRLDFVFGHTNAGLIWLVVISAITGWVLGIVTAFLVRRRTRWRRAG